MARFRFSHRAEADLLNIWLYTVTPYETFRLDMSQRLAIEQDADAALTATFATLPLVTRMFLLGLSGPSDHRLLRLSPRDPQSVDSE